MIKTAHPGLIKNVTRYTKRMMSFDKVVTKKTFSYAQPELWDFKCPCVCKVQVFCVSNQVNMVHIHLMGCSCVLHSSVTMRSMIYINYLKSFRLIFIKISTDIHLSSTERIHHYILVKQTHG